MKKLKAKYGQNIDVLNRIATNRGGLIQIRVALPPDTVFKKDSDNVFWVRAD
jgi:hypothetical protein